MCAPLQHFPRRRPACAATAGREWIERYASEHPELAEALADGTIRTAAKQTTSLWHRACEQRVLDLRRTKAVRDEMSRSQTHRSITGIVRAAVTQHETLATFLSEPLDGLQRWQMYMILVTLVISQLLVSIWMCVRASRLPACLRCLTPACATLCTFAAAGAAQVLRKSARRRRAQDVTRATRLTCVLVPAADRASTVARSCA
jgi:hypothetical protein